MPIPKNTARKIPFVLVHYQNGSVLTGAVVSAYRCLDGAIQEPVDGSIVELGNGQYSFEGMAADFNADFTDGLLFVASNAVPAHIVFQMTYFRKDTAYDIPFLLLNVNTNLGLTGASPSGIRCLDGGAQEPVDGTFIELGNGQYVFQATAADFNADDIIGFLITASGAVPIHMVIDLLESYTTTDVLTDNPAAIIANYLTGLALMSVPGAGDWPLYISHLPDGINIADNAGVVYNTTPVKDGRSMTDGSRMQHYGIQITIRSLTEEEGWDKCNVLAGQMDVIYNAETIFGGTTYRVHNVTNMGGINSLGEEEGTKRRKMFTMNFLISLTKL